MSLKHHTVVYRGSQPVASVHSDSPDHDAQVARAISAAHSQNTAEGASLEVKSEVQEYEHKDAVSTKKGK